jgi:hypothetical protein
VKRFARVLLLPLALVLVSVSTSAAAKEKPEWRSWPGGDRFYGSIGYYRAELQTRAAISDLDGNLGGKISFEDSLGLSDSKGTALVSFAWRISKRNSLSVNYFKLDRSATQNSTIDIIIPNPEPPPDTIEADVTLPLSAVFNIESTDITYAFSAIAKEKHNLAVGVGLAVQDLQFGFKPTEDCTDPECDLINPQEAKTTAPLPTVKLAYDYAINDKWLVGVSAGYFALSLELDSDVDLSGRIIDLGAKVRWKTWKHAGFNLGYKFFDVDFEYEEGLFKAEADYDYRGFVLGIEGFY